MISLKKSFEYENYLKGLYSEACMLLRDSSFMTVTKAEHYIHSVNKEEEDKVEEITSSIKNSYNFITPNQLIDFVVYINNERKRLAEAVALAKTNEPLNQYDVLIKRNTSDRELLSILDIINKIKGKEDISEGYGRKFNNDGEQVEYSYDVKKITTINFDRNKTKTLAFKLRSVCNYTSEKIDVLLLKNTVDFDTVFEVGESFEDAFERYLNK